LCFHIRKGERRVAVTLSFPGFLAVLDRFNRAEEQAQHSSQVCFQAGFCLLLYGTFIF